MKPNRRGHRSVVFLRGVNVGGHRAFRPKLLAEAMSHYDVVNVGAAGTFVVNVPVSEKALRAELIRRLPFQTEIMICSEPDLLSIASGDPFQGEPSSPDIVRFVSVLAKPLSTPPRLPICLPSNDGWLLKVNAIRGKFVYGLYRRQMRAISFLGQVEKQLGVPATTRNWNTMSSLIQLLSDPTQKGRDQKVWTKR